MSGSRFPLKEYKKMPNLFKPHNQKVLNEKEKIQLAKKDFIKRLEKDPELLTVKRKLDF